MVALSALGMVPLLLPCLLTLQLASQAGASSQPVDNADLQDGTASGTPFPIQVSLSGHRFQRSKHYWAFSGRDTVIVDNIEDAASFHFEDGQLKSQDSFINIEISNGYAIPELDSNPSAAGIAFSIDANGDLQCSGPSFSSSSGNDHGSYCVSKDGNIFVVASKKPPFSCQPITLRPKGLDSSLWSSASKLLGLHDSHLLTQRDAKPSSDNPSATIKSPKVKARSPLLDTLDSIIPAKPDPSSDPDPDKTHQWHQWGPDPSSDPEPIAEVDLEIGEWQEE